MSPQSKKDKKKDYYYKAKSDKKCEHPDISLQYFELPGTSKLNVSHNHPTHFPFFLQHRY